MSPAIRVGLNLVSACALAWYVMPLLRWFRAWTRVQATVWTNAAEAEERHRWMSKR